jgi:hypothetical protein
MAENIVEQIMVELRQTAAEHYPSYGEPRNVRMVGHTPKTDHYIYDVVVDFSSASERVAAKVYRASKCGAQGTRKMASTESENLQFVYGFVRSGAMAGVPRPIGDFSAMGAVVTEKLSGIPLQSIIMKAALLPGYADHGMLRTAARNSGNWLREFHQATALPPAIFDHESLLKDLETLCHNCRSEGLDDNSIRKITSGARGILASTKRVLPQSAVIYDFTPLNVMVGPSVGFCDFGRMATAGNSLQDVAVFLASVEALEKYPFCNRLITSEVQKQFLQAYDASENDLEVLRVLKMKALLAMFAQGRNVKESAIRKKVMWANVMKRFIQQAADRSLAPAA